MKNSTVRAGDWLRFASHFLETLPGKQKAHSPEDAHIEAHVLLAHVLEKPRVFVISHPEVILTPQQQNRLTKLLARLAHSEPLPYLIGHWEFYGLDFEVTPAVLIPRPETELMVERAQAWLQQHPHLRRGADVGTGSGCIAISLAKQIKDLRVLAVDRSWEALQVARRNAVFHQVTERVAFVQGDLLTAVKGPFDLVCANLPYIPRSSLESLSVAHHEPRQALDGGSDGVSWIRQLIDDAPRWLSAPALMLLEMQYNQGDTVSELARSRFPNARINILPDLAGLPRLVEIENPVSGQ